MKRVFILLTLAILTIHIGFSQWIESVRFSQFYPITESDISFSDPQNGYLVIKEYLSPSSGSSLYLRKTTDFAQNWTLCDYNQAYLSTKEISTNHPDTVFSFQSSSGISRLIYSYDGGKTFHSQQIDVNYPIDMFYLNNKNIFFITAGIGTPKLQRLTNGTKQILNIPDTLSLNNSKIYFTNASVGYLTFLSNSNNYMLLHTTDGGNSWLQRAAINYKVNDMYFISDSVGFLACASGKILKTVDFGQNFTELNSTTDVNLNAIQFVNDRVGYCAGNEGICLRTDDRGATWQQENLNTTAHLKRIMMFTEDMGYILSSDHVLYRKNINTDTDNLTESNLELYPNPTNGLLYINACPVESIQNVKIYNIQGRLMDQPSLSGNSIDISALKYGMYIVEVYVQNKIYYKKVLLN